MWEKIHDKIESVFEVKQTKFTGTRIFITFSLIVLMAFSLPMYFRYEEKVHQEYSAEYQQVKDWTTAFYHQEGKYPLGRQVNLDDEKDLSAFFQENSLNTSRTLYYVNSDDLPQLNTLKYTYVIDGDNGALFTTEYVIYKMRRMHIPGH